MITNVDAVTAKHKLTVQLATNTNSHSFFSDHPDFWEEVVEAVRTTVVRRLTQLEELKK